METASYHFKLKSHPGRLLCEHCRGVWENAQKQLDLCSFNFAPFSQNEIKEVQKIACLLHDFGKATPWFQRYINNLQGQFTSNENSLRQHGLISAFITFGIINEKFPEKIFLSVLGFIIVRKHHGDLESYRNLLTVSDQEYEICNRQLEKIDYSEFREIVRDYELADYINKEFLSQVISEVRTGKFRRFRQAKSLSNTFDINYYFVVNFLYSLLTNADKTDAIFQTVMYRDAPILKSNDVVNFKKTLSQNSDKFINKVREAIFEEVNNTLENYADSSRIYSINTPTGSGKTITALFAALKLREKYNLSRIIYCLPYTSIIDQNYAVINEIRDFAKLPDESDILLKHHHLADIHYHHRTDDYLEKNYSSDEALHLIEGWESRIIVTTFVQFILSLISNQNAALRKFHKFSNSVIILDEIQTIPHEYWSLIKTTLEKTAELLNSRIILVTATMPLIFSEEKQEIKELVPFKTELFQKLSRIELDVSHCNQGNMSWETFCSMVKSIAQDNANKDILVVLNTISSARELFNYINETNIAQQKEYLSSHVVPKERLKRIESIRKRDRNKPALVISTQLVEAGVDIDFDIVIRDFAPLDSIFQTCGRCNRENRQGVKGRVILMSILDSNNRRPSQKIYDRFLLEKTKKVLENKEIVQESEFYHIALAYYLEVKGDQTQQVSEDILAAMKSLEYTDNEGKVFTDKLKLIDEDFRKSVFVELDENATRVWQNYLRTLRLEDNFEKRAVLKQARRFLADYIINIPQKCLQDEPEYGIYHLKQSEVGKYYDKTVGFDPNCNLPKESTTLCY